jgi:hypothetical protein
VRAPPWAWSLSPQQYATPLAVVPQVVSYHPASGGEADGCRHEPGRGGSPEHRLRRAEHAVGVVAPAVDASVHGQGAGVHVGDRNLLHRGGNGHPERRAAAAEGLVVGGALVGGAGARAEQGCPREPVGVLPPARQPASLVDAARAARAHAHRDEPGLRRRLRSGCGAESGEKGQAGHHGPERTTHTVSRVEGDRSSGTPGRRCGRNDRKSWVSPL